MNKIISFIKQKLFEPRITTLASNTLTPEDIRKFLGAEASDLSDEEVGERLANLPIEEKLKAFFGKKDGQ
jgi:hypothetical protein